MPWASCPSTSTRIYLETDIKMAPFSETRDERIGQYLVVRDNSGRGHRGANVGALGEVASHSVGYRARARFSRAAGHRRFPRRSNARVLNHARCHRDRLPTLRGAHCVLLDPSEGEEQEMIEDCQVCCRPILYRVVWRNGPRARTAEPVDS
jgi:hypothetical protein